MTVTAIGTPRGGEGPYPRRVMLVHNRYKERGGEDVVFETEGALLERRGHEVVRVVVGNQEIPDAPSLLHGARLATETVWSARGAAFIRSRIRESRPELVHAHNTFPQLSPSIYSACRREGVPVVQTLHNYRLVCPAATLFRDGGPCEDCLGRVIPWPGVLHACYRSSRTQTAAVAAMLALNRIRGTWAQDVDAYIALTEFARRKFVEGGLPADRIVVKPNAVYPDPLPPATPGHGFLYLGRLSAEKGIATLLDAWREITIPSSLRIAGEGPLAPTVRRAATDTVAVEYVGRLAGPDVHRELRAASALIVPSVCYEGHPMAILEAFAAGRPVIASRLGAMAEIVEEGRTGLLFRAGDAGDLVRAVRWAADHPEDLARMGAAARSEFTSRYGDERNYQQLVAIYRRVLAARFARSGAAT